MESRDMRRDLLARIDAFRERHDLSEWQFGSHALANPKWLGRLRDPNTGVSFSSIDKAEAFMRLTDSLIDKTDDEAA